MPVRIAGSAADYHVFRNRLLKEIPAAGAGASMVARHVDGTFQRKPGLHHLGFAFHLRVPCNQEAHISGCQADSDRVVVGVLIAFILGSQNREGGVSERKGIAGGRVGEGNTILLYGRLERLEHLCVCLIVRRQHLGYLEAFRAPLRRLSDLHRNGRQSHSPESPLPALLNRRQPGKKFSCLRRQTEENGRLILPEQRGPGLRR